MALLNKGDKIIIVSPSSCIETNALDSGVKWLESLGLRVEIAKHAYDSKSYTAGTDFERADDINKAFADNSIKAIFCSRGGAGATKMLDYLDFNLIKNNPKPIFGLSDSTALQNALYHLEDIGEKSYKIDLMLNQLKQQEGFDKIKGIIFGKFTDCIEINNGDGSVESIIKNFAEKLNIPVIFDFDYGHVKSKYVLPIGQEIELDANHLKIKIPNL